MLKSRGFMFAASSLWVALILVIFVFRGGGAVPIEPRLEPSRLSPGHEAEALAARGDYEGAWALYHQAIQDAPENVSLWYALGVTLSHLDQRKATEDVFQHVVRHGRPDSEEVQVARRWLVSAGALVPPVTFTIAAEPVRATGDKAVVTGKVAWGALDPNRPVPVAHILLAGKNGLAEGKRFKARAHLGESYRFERLPPGSYRLIGAAGGQRLWDLTLSVEDGREVRLDLGRENSNTPTVALNR